MELEHARLTAGRSRQRRHRNLASSLEATEKGTLGRHGERGRAMVNRLARGGDGRLVSRTGGDRERTLAWRREHHLGRQSLADAPGQAETHESRRRQENAGPLAASVELGQPGVHVAPDVDHDEVWTDMEHL